MSDLYNRIMELCKAKGISGYRMCKDIGIQPSILTDLKMERQKGLSAENANKIASYLDVTVAYLLGKGENEKAPTLTSKDERNIEETVKVAFLRGIADKAGVKLSDKEANELWEDSVDYMSIKLEQRKRRNGK